MVDKERLVELAERCEAATGPDRELDATIFGAAGVVNEDHCRRWCSMDGRTDLTRDRFIEAWAPSYTASLDAALTLVPEGHNWGVGPREEWHSGPELAWAWCDSSGEDWDDSLNRRAATPALALCAAALKARSNG